MNKKILIAPFAALILFLCGCGASATDTETASEDKAKESETTETESSASNNEGASESDTAVRETEEAPKSDTSASESKESTKPEDFFTSEEGSTGLPESESPLEEESAGSVGADTLESESSSAEPVDGKVTFEGVNFELPSDYISLGEIEEMGIPLVAYQHGSNVINVVAEDISTYPDLTMETYVELSKQQTGFDYSSDETYEINGMETNELISNMDGLTTQQNTFIHDGTAYIFTFSAMDETYEQDKESFKKVLESVSFESGSNI
ncbi:hypothetical protein SFC66_04610 [Terribacillus saccharophilus]|uniref:hypothetical protein n=1 Tax=Terribacillus saccharophilus TaxID=361277 RepID=UPI003981EBD0